MTKKSSLFGKNIQRRSADLPWLYRFNINGETFSGETHTHNAKEAEAFVAALKAKKLGQAKDHRQLGLTPMAFGEACDLWWNEKGRHAAHPRPEIIAWLRKTIDTRTLLQDINKPLIIRVREARRNTARRVAGGAIRKVMDSTVNNTLQTLAAIMNYAHLNHAAPITPIRWGDIALDLGEREIRVLTKDELRKILAALRDDMHDVIHFALASAKRIDEILSLTWGQIDFDVAHPMMRLRTKGNKRSHSPLSARSVEILARQRAHQTDPQPADRVFTFVARQTRSYFHRTTKAVTATHIAGKRYPLDYGMLRREFDLAVKEMKLASGVTIHVLRHTAATWMLQAGVPIQDVSRALDHADIAITLKHYAKVSQHEVRTALDALGNMLDATVATKLQQTSPVLRLVAAPQG